MKKLVAWWKGDSARIFSIVLALAAAGLIPGTAGKIIGVVLPLLGGQAVRATVSSPLTVATKVGQAALSVAGQLGQDTVGAPGLVPPAAQAVVDGVVAGVLGQTP